MTTLGKPSSSCAFTLATLLALCLVPAGSATAQGFSLGGGSSQLRGVIVERDDVTGRATRSFERRAEARLRAFDSDLITVPNAQRMDRSLHNVGARGAIRRRFRIGLESGTAPEKTREAMEIVSADRRHRGPHAAFRGRPGIGPRRGRCGQRAGR